MKAPDWDIRREGRRWSHEEFDRRTDQAPEKIESVGGIFASERERLNVLGMLLDYRRNWTFLGSDRGGRTAAVLSSVTGTCRHRDRDPFADPQDILRRLPTHPADQLDERRPDVWFASHRRARRKSAA